MNKKYMKIAIDLAKKGKGKVNPNPLVGAVIVKNEKIIAEGYHMVYGEAHAEVNAFNNATCDVEGATMYVTLEPCSHFGKTPPCADKIIEKKIKRVVIGSLDPNPLVAGNGIKKLKEAGIEVEAGVLESECNELNEVFMKYIVSKKPFVVMKCAMSLDGKIATSYGESKWITGEASRGDVHETRNELSGIMVGVNTVIKDNPELTCRIENGRNPVRIIVDSTLRIPLESKVVTEVYKAKTIIATTKKASEDKIKILEDKGVTILIVNLKNDKVDLNDLMIKLGELKIDSILLEGGATLNFSALDEGIVDKVQMYIAPKIIGGEMSKTPVGGNGIEALKDAYKLRNLTTRVLGDDILIEGYIE
ncbi:bifunctional diaminohydroxyphosphoribosylaminopyrimidine deaminase/5-amino-6-(5-phosphoribosylamino)uracil reductase RibD [Clostridium cylindrosporum]|uniref:Riboflavin biosynthesis protein RibD n=1 Tax=Clostridium cylindrosporum DSM 605 TaxID=1121307 RepID=A0A0J8D9P4_CLOCY|nr:bifunctional diaminohydroxyphosphoribosylaminopyrimidine deaminase/5-amino-6-(5-phosphoribosylamino)uracil reductase RibD [Clostridium cylindrosporum]KMT21003.1 riboflavin biosynthesis protein RibD [Clostridium cylindrosporum DSM 605]